MISSTTRRENIILVLKAIKDILIQIIPKDRSLLDIEIESIKEFVDKNFDTSEIDTDQKSKLSAKKTESIFQIV